VKLNDLKPAPGAKKKRTRVGRGIAAGKGKTAGRGQKGQKSRAGYSRGAGWEGGRSALIARLPKRGFTRVGIAYQLVNVGALSAFDDGTTVDADALRARGLVRHADRPIKLLGDGEFEPRALHVRVDAASRGAARAIVAAGGTIVARTPGDEDAAEAEADSATAASDTDTTAADAEPADAAAADAAADEGSSEEQA
jgi:large subunit ribosomal protein L15